MNMKWVAGVMNAAMGREPTEPRPIDGGNGGGSGNGGSGNGGGNGRGNGSGNGVSKR